ncbi:galactosylgalactosylxylosylprotein 3-beta-glucuronosyltransferase 3-like isoform X2 [Symsagittifera roscoffensis]|uniref:galactosylgalactosylxylosylprotein 3-beta-glucuronosyltransferase 3-like isoform X2 n=1 Tax=Symsagittifera roscoffensis TaxID=84072 RepID=UPI00307C49FE
MLTKKSRFFGASSPQIFIERYPRESQLSYDNWSNYIKEGGKKFYVPYIALGSYNKAWYHTEDKPSPVNGRAKQTDNRLIMITPTYNRSSQIPDLLRTKQTLQLVPNCDWIVVEDANQTNPLVLRYLQDYSSGNLFYIHAWTEQKYKQLKGRTQRNTGIRFVEKLYAKAESEKTNRNDKNPFRSAVVYFGDDDNSYDSKFLILLKGTKRLSLFSVGLIASTVLEGPIAEENKIIGFQSSWWAHRKFPIDMAGFAINVGFMHDKNYPKFGAIAAGFQESNYLEKFQLHPSKAEYIHGEFGLHVWHTKTVVTKDIHQVPVHSVYLNGTVVNNRAHKT